MDMRLPIALIIAVMLALGLWQGCANEHGLEPGPAKYVLYAGLHGTINDPSAIIGIYDIDTDSIVDSITGGLSTDVWVVASEDGRSLATFTPGGIPTIWDAITQSPRGYLQSFALLPLFLPDTGLIVGPRPDSTMVYDLQSLDLIDIWHTETLFAVHIPGTHRIVGTNEYTSPLRANPSRLIVYDYRDNRIVDSALGSGTDFEGSRLRELCVSPDGNRVFVIGSTILDQGPAIIAWDWEDNRALFNRKLGNGNGSCSVTPDGRELWVTDPGDYLPPFPLSPGEILILDALGGEILDTIMTEGLDPRFPDKAFFVDRIRFHPDLPKAYVNARYSRRSPGMILVIDTDSHEILQLLRDPNFRDVDWIDLAPAPR